MKFFGTHQYGGWLDYIGPNSMMIENIGDLMMYRVSAYAYLILSSQASARLHIMGNMASAAAGALTAQKAFLNNFGNIVNHRVDI